MRSVNFVFLSVAVATLALVGCDSSDLMPQIRYSNFDPTAVVSDEIFEVDTAGEIRPQECALVYSTNKIRSIADVSNGTLFDARGEIQFGTESHAIYNRNDVLIPNSFKNFDVPRMVYNDVLESAVVFPANTTIYDAAFSAFDFYFTGLRVKYPNKPTVDISDYGIDELRPCFYIYTLTLFNDYYEGTYPGGRMPAPEGVSIKPVGNISASKFSPRAIPKASSVNASSKKFVAINSFDLADYSVKEASKNDQGFSFKSGDEFRTFLAQKGPSSAKAVADAQKVNSLYGKVRTATKKVARKFNGNVFEAFAQAQIEGVPLSLQNKIRQMANFANSLPAATKK